MLKRTLGSTSSNSINSDARALAGAAPNQGASTGENGQRIQVGSGGNGPVNDGNFDPQTTQSGDVQPLVRRAKPNNYANDPAANVMVSLQAQGPIQDLSPHALLELKQKFLEACFNGDVGKIHAMLTGRNSQDKKTLIFLTGFRSSTALMAAARGGHVGAMDVLLGALNEQERKELIFEKRLGRSTSLSDPEFFGFFDRDPAENALMAAAKGGHVGAMDVLLGALNEQDKKTLIIEEGSGGVTALRLAAQNGHMAVVQALLQVLTEPADINHTDHFGRTTLMLAAKLGHNEMAVAILDRLAQLGRPPEPNFLTDVDRSMIEIAGWNVHIEALLGWLPSGADSDNKLSEPDRKELIDIFLSACKRSAHSPLPYAKYGLEDADSLLLELAIEKGQPGALNTWLRQNRVVTPEEIHRTMAAWRINHQAVDAVAGLPSPKNDVHITAMHDWDYLTQFFIEEVVQRIGSKDADRSAGA